MLFQEVGCIDRLGDRERLDILVEVELLDLPGFVEEDPDAVSLGEYATAVRDALLAKIEDLRELIGDLEAQFGLGQKTAERD